jgi:transposase
MLTLPATVRVFVATQPVDLRKGFDGLQALVWGALGTDPSSGHLYVFRNRREDQMKVLFFDRTGYAVFHKRLAQGAFRIPEASGAARIEVSASELLLILEGIDLRGARRSKRWTPRPPK